MFCAPERDTVCSYSLNIPRICIPVCGRLIGVFKSVCFTFINALQFIVNL